MVPLVCSCRCPQVLSRLVCGHEQPLGTQEAELSSVFPASSEDNFWNYCFRSPVPLKTLPVSHLQPPVSPVPASDNFLRMKRDQLSDWSDYPFQ